MSIDWPSWIVPCRSSTSSFPLQVNSVLALPGLFRGALEARALEATTGMKFAAIQAITSCIEEPTPRRILPSPFNRSAAVRVAEEVAAAAVRGGACFEQAK